MTEKAQRLFLFAFECRLLFLLLCLKCPLLVNTAKVVQSASVSFQLFFAYIQQVKKSNQSEQPLFNGLGPQTVIKDHIDQPWFYYNLVTPEYTRCAMCSFCPYLFFY